MLRLGSDWYNGLLGTGFGFQTWLASIVISTFEILQQPFPAPTFPHGFVESIGLVCRL